MILIYIIFILLVDYFLYKNTSSIINNLNKKILLIVVNFSIIIILSYFNEKYNTTIYQKEFSVFLISLLFSIVPIIFITMIEFHKKVISKIIITKKNPFLNIENKQNFLLILYIIVFLIQIAMIFKVNSWKWKLLIFKFVYR